MSETEVSQVDGVLTRLEKSLTVVKYLGGGVIALLAIVFAMGASYNSALSDIATNKADIAQLKKTVAEQSEDLAVIRYRLGVPRKP